MATDEVRLGEFLVPHGGPFYPLQRLLGLLRKDALRAGSRALVFVGLAWGAPLMMSLAAGAALGTAADRPYLLDPSVSARVFIAVGLFVLMDRQVKDRMRAYLVQFARAPLSVAAPMTRDAVASVRRYSCACIRNQTRSRGRVRSGRHRV